MEEKKGEMETETGVSFFPHLKILNRARGRKSREPYKGDEMPWMKKEVDVQEVLGPVAVASVGGT